ncbi:NADH-quinone oxidoreductase subunit J family protein [Ornithinicoccus hortensis]|uniref:NADH-quinone oxidoreductase subunit J n=1 Tax=Ornithinicoccus hortensis TaxID=82346 RepID=A0A542YPI3_9MICO|nr:NADH-quinone oxidoreductase subunit J [Ornithinicoccus hortensis]TQL49957.1 NADH-quinone oxidoreductase subunit J [Ornithinicoccus hortensis]
MTSRDVLFVAVGLLTAASAILAVTSRRVLHAGLWLVVSMGALAGCYLVLGAELVALVQLLVYVGAVVVLVLFALMMTRSGTTPEDAPPGVRVLSAVVALAVTVLLGGTLVATFGWDGVAVTGPDGSAVGEAVFGTWVWPFELLSLLLLAALVAAVAVATAGKGRVK